MARARKNSRDNFALAVVGVGGLWLYWRYKKRQEGAEKASFDALVTAAVAEAEAKKLPSAGAAPQGANGPTTASGPGAAPSAPFIPPGQDTNLWWWPEREIYVTRSNPAPGVVARAAARAPTPCPLHNHRRGTSCTGRCPRYRCERNLARKNGAWDYVESGVTWATGAKEGEGYLPDSWSFGTKEKIKEGAVEAGKMGVEITTGHDPDEPWLPEWVLPTVVFGGLGLGAFWLARPIIMKKL